ncbi:MAG: TPM domain-containing protein [Archangium sp.]
MSALLPLLLAATIPVIDAPIVDQAGVLSAQASTDLSARIREHRDASGVQLAVLVVDTTGELAIEDFSAQVMKQWGGGSKARDDGALFVLAVSDRTMRLELGYGLEPLIPDGAASQMLQALRPSLREANYDAAIGALVADFVFRTKKGAEPSVVSELPPLEPARSFGEDLARHLLPFPIVCALFAVLGWFTRKRYDEARADEDRPTSLEPFHLVMLHGLAVALFTGVMLLFGLDFSVWWPAFAGGLLGYHREPLRPVFTVSIFVAASTVVNWMMFAMFRGSLDGAVIGGVMQAVVFVPLFMKAIDFEFVSLESDQDRADRRRVNSILGSGSSWGHRSGSSSSSSSWGSSSRSSSSSSSSSSRSSGGYSGGGGGFGGGGASSSW